MHVLRDGWQQAEIVHRNKGVLILANEAYVGEGDAARTGLAFVAEEVEF